MIHTSSRFDTLARNQSCILAPEVVAYQRYHLETSQVRRKPASRKVVRGSTATELGLKEKDGSILETR